MSALTVELDDETLAALALLSQTTGRSRADLISQAIQTYVETADWQVALIQEGLEAVRRGDFATDDEVAAVLSRRRGPRKT